jgi:hypothetical protein
MNREFVPYTEALALKELGFDELCFGYYNIDPQLKNPAFNMVKPFEHIWCLPAPLYQQVFRWFREKHNLYSVCFPELDKWVIEIKELKGFEGNPAVIGYPDLEYTSYEEAELACLIKLIELVKKK